MNAMMNWLAAAGAYRLGWTLLHSLWQGALIAAAFAVARIALRRSSAQARYLAACSALVLLAATPVLTFLQGPERLFPSFVHPANPTAPGGAAVGFGEVEPGQSMATGGEMSSWIWGAAVLVDRNLPLAVMAWLLGLVLFLFRWLQGCWWVRRVKRHRVMELGPEWMGRLNDLKHRLAVSRPVRLLQSSIVDVPMVIGWLRPLILFPTSALTALTPMQLEAILAHELVHVRRHDYLVNTLQHLVEAILFYHPATWWLSRCIRQEREHCCDDLVVRLCGDRLGYAQALMTLEELRGVGLQLALAAGGGSLLQRIRRLLGADSSEQPLGAREFSALALLGAGCLCMFAGLALMLAPKEYLAGCIIKVEPDLAATGPGVFSNPWFIQTEFEVIRSPLVLDRALDSLQLPEQWAGQSPAEAASNHAQAISRLQSRLNLRPIRNTSLLELQVRDSEPEHAARIANAVAKAYRDYRLDAQARRGQQGLEALDQRLVEVERNIADVQGQLGTLRAKLNIPASLVTAADPTGAAQALSVETSRHIEALRLDTQNDLIRQQTLLDKLKSLAGQGDQLAEAIPTSGITDSLLNSLLEQKTVAEQRLVSLRREYGPQHAEVLKAGSQVEDLQQKLRERENGILVGLEVRVASLRQSLDNLQAETERATQAQAEFADQAQPYLLARSHLDELQKIHQELELKIASVKTDLALPKDARVEIIESAVASTHPAWPNSRLAGVLLGSGLFLALLGILLAKSGPRQVGIPALA